jgi:hypothetical protein
LFRDLLAQVAEVPGCGYYIMVKEHEGVFACTLNYNAQVQCFDVGPKVCLGETRSYSRQ